MHTSASLTINENASPDVPVDLNVSHLRAAVAKSLRQDSLDRIVPEGNFYRHDEEGSDDMPAHVKVGGPIHLLCLPGSEQSSLMGPSLTVPITKGRLALGIWQGIYLNEHRNYGGSRSIVVTIQGKRKQ